MNDELCPRCGVDWGTVRKMLVDSGENYALALVICQNCSDCQEHFRAWFRGKPFEIEEVEITRPCPICGARQEQRVDGHWIHTIFTKESWKLHEEEARQSISRERAAKGNEPPQIKPVFGGKWS